MVGALADWFAVTALFRHPLGLPIPHTAIIPKRKDQIGRSLGEFVQGNFLTREVLDRAARRRPRRPAARTLAGRPGPRRRARRRPSPTPCGARSRCSTTATCRRRSAASSSAGCGPRDVAPLLGQGDRRRDRGRPPPAAARRRADAGSRSFLDDNRATLRGRLDAGVAVVGARADRRPDLQQDLRRRAAFLADVAGRARSTRCAHSIDERIRAARRAAARRPGADRQGRGAQGRAARRTPTCRRGSAVAVGRAEADDPDASRRPRQRAAPPRSPTASRRLGERLATDAELQDKVDDWVERLVVYVVEQLPRRGRRPDRHHRRALGRRRHVPAHRAAGRPRPAVHPHQRHGRRRPRRPA